MAGKEVFPVPEALGRQDREAVAWTVESGQAKRGDAWTDQAGGRMRVPTYKTESARIVRAHELMHAKISPLVSGPALMQVVEKLIDDGRVNDCLWGGDVEDFHAAEEYRVNVALANAGFNLDALADGSEKPDGEELGRAGTDHARSVAFTYAAGMVGTKALNAFLAGLRKEQPEWVVGIKAMAKAMKKELKPWTGRESWKKGTSYDTRAFGTTPLSRYGGLPEGFINKVPQLATIIHSYAKRTRDLEMEKGLKPEFGQLPDYADDPGGWDQLIFDRNVRLDQTHKGSLASRRKPAVSGRRLAHPSRMLTDPNRRIFDSPRKQPGGVTLIDQSGSMSLTEDQVRAIVKAAPGMLVLGYSSNGQEGLPNIWVHAENGKMASRLHRGNGGNGVDGPALAYAIRRRKAGDPIIWVSDGAVTGDGDSTNANLAEQCAEMVIRHKVHMVEDVETAIKGLRGPRGNLRRATAVGRINRAAGSALRKGRR